MEVSKKRMISKPKPERVQEKTLKSDHRVLKERRLFLTQICTQGEAEPARKSGLNPKTESVQNKPLNSVKRVEKKKRLTEIIQSPVPAQGKRETKPHLTTKPAHWVEKPETFIDGVGMKRRLMET